jgi:hypothetical protein
MKQTGGSLHRTQTNLVLDNATAAEGIDKARDEDYDKDLWPICWIFIPKNLIEPATSRGRTES